MTKCRLWNIQKITFFYSSILRARQNTWKFHNIAVLIKKNGDAAALSCVHITKDVCDCGCFRERVRERKEGTSVVQKSLLETLRRRFGRTNHYGLWYISFMTKLLSSCRPHVCNSLCISNLQNRGQCIKLIRDPLDFSTIYRGRRTQFET